MVLNLYCNCVVWFYLLCSVASCHHCWAYVCSDSLLPFCIAALLWCLDNVAVHLGCHIFKQDAPKISKIPKCCLVLFWKFNVATQVAPAHWIVCFRATHWCVAWVFWYCKWDMVLVTAACSILGCLYTACLMLVLAAVFIIHSVLVAYTMLQSKMLLLYFWYPFGRGKSSLIGSLAFHFYHRCILAYPGVDVPGILILIGLVC